MAHQRGPTDYLSDDDAHDARSAMFAIASNGLEISEHMLCGEAHPEKTIGTLVLKSKILGGAVQSGRSMFKI